MDYRILPGLFSEIGKKTDRALNTIRTKIQQDENAAIAHEAKKSGNRAPVSPDARKLDRSSSRSMSLPLTSPDGKMSAKTSLGTLEKLGFKKQQSLTNADTSKQEALAEAAAEVQALLSRDPPPPLEEIRPTRAFTSLGMDTGVYCENARASLGRFVAPTKNELRPEIGHYRAQYSLVKEKTPCHSFGERTKHPNRKKTEQDLERERQEIISTSRSMSSTRASTSPKMDLEQMSLSRERPPLSAICFIRMGVVSEPAEDLLDQDKKLSHLERMPKWDFGKLKARGDTTKTNYFEPGKCNVQVSPSSKGNIDFTHRISRSASLGSHASPKAILQPDAGKNLIPDRSLYRSGGLARPRVQKVLDFSKETKRPPLVSGGKAMYDEDSPDAYNATLRHEMTFELSSADHAVIHRTDMSPNMSNALNRNEAARGARIVQWPTATTTEALDSCPVDRCKESPSRPRPDRGTMSFAHTKGRQPVTSSPNRSSLGQPRESVAPDFERTPPKPGFATTAQVSRDTAATRNSRKHLAMPDWSSREHEDEELERTLIAS